MLKEHADSKSQLTEDRDGLLTPAEMAEKLRTSVPVLLQNVRRKKIPCVRINARVLRFHFPTVLAKLQK